MSATGRTSPSTVGVKADGTVVAVGDNDFGQCNVDNWTDIIQVAAGDEHTVGLKFDGTVVAVGSDSAGQCDVSGWTGIVQVAAGGPHTVGVKADGTMVAAGNNYYGQCDVGNWTDIAKSPTAPSSPWEATLLGSALSAAGRVSYRSPQVGLTR